MNHRQRNATLVFLQASEERRVFSARPHVSNFLILHHESSCIWIFYVFFVLLLPVQILVMMFSPPRCPNTKQQLKENLQHP